VGDGRNARWPEDKLETVRTLLRGNASGRRVGGDPRSITGRKGTDKRKGRWNAKQGVTSYQWEGRGWKESAW